MVGDQTPGIGDGGKVALGIVAAVGGGVLLCRCGVGAGEEESEEDRGAGRGDAVGDCVAGITISDTVPEIPWILSPKFPGYCPRNSQLSRWR